MYFLLYFLFSVLFVKYFQGCVSSLVTISSSVANLIMENLWETIDPDLAQTATFLFHEH